MLNNRGTQAIQTERLLLRRFTPADAEAMFQNWANDPMVTRYVTWPPHGSLAVTQELLASWCQAYERDDNYNWAIEYEGKLVGSISVVRLNAKVEWADLGYCLSRSCWSKGIMTEAVLALVDYLFCEVGVNRIGIDLAAQNLASGRVAQKCGFTYEGTARAYIKVSTGDILDVKHYSLLREEWLAQKA